MLTLLPSDSSEYTLACHFIVHALILYPFRAFFKPSIVVTPRNFLPRPAMLKMPRPLSRAMVVNADTLSSSKSYIFPCNWNSSCLSMVRATACMRSLLMVVGFMVPLPNGVFP